jgi:hypothetical protein
MKGDVFPRKFTRIMAFGAHWARISASIFGFSSWPDCVRVGHDAIRATVVFNNLNNKQFVVYFPGFRAMVRGRSMTCGAGSIKSARSASAAREREAKGGSGREATGTERAGRRRLAERVGGTPSPG